jgi:glyoxylase-like metal-dependent hydrolase (beta-lactamase superfamily II)
MSSVISVKKFTSSEVGAWSNAYLIHGSQDAILFDVFMLKADTSKLVDEIRKTGKKLSRVFVSHAHPDHFMGLEVISDAFPNLEVLSTADVVKDVVDDSPWILKILQQNLGKDGPTRVVLPKPIEGRRLTLEGEELVVHEYDESESKHIATIFIPSLKALVASDLIYNDTHCYLQERHLDSWLRRLNELEKFVATGVTTIYPGHGEPGDPATLIERTRAYLRDFSSALHHGSAHALEEEMLAKYPHNHAKQFLTVFSVPAYYPNKGPTEASR